MKAAMGELTGLPIEIVYRRGLRDTAGNEAHAATFLRQRLILLDAGLRRDAREHRRILTHELFHFVWVRLGNRKRLEWERLLQAEHCAGARGEAGWSAEWRKRQLTEADRTEKTRKWREYCCEAFCDSAASIELTSHAERTLSGRNLHLRAQWFQQNFGSGRIPI